MLRLLIKNKRGAIQMPQLEQLSSGHGLIEGPLFEPSQGLLFTDTTNGGVHCLSPDGKVAELVPVGATDPRIAARRPRLPPQPGPLPDAQAAGAGE